MLEVLAFGAQRVQRAQCHSVVVRTEDGYTVAVLRTQGDLVELLTPENPEFAGALRILEAVAKVPLPPPTGVRLETRNE